MRVFKKEERKSRLMATETEQRLHKRKAGSFMEKRQAEMSLRAGKISPPKEIKGLGLLSLLEDA